MGFLRKFQLLRVHYLNSLLDKRRGHTRRLRLSPLLPEARKQEVWLRTQVLRSSSQVTSQIINFLNLLFFLALKWKSWTLTP